METQQFTTKRIITVIGASGKQGSSVINRLLETSRHEFTLRGVVRPADGSKPRVLQVAKKGVECVFANYMDVNSLRDAVRGSYGVFAMTDWWTRPDIAYQTQMGKNICDACLTTGVQHIIWSSAPHSTKLSKGAMASIGAFDSKAEVEEYIEQRKAITGMAATYLLAAWFMSHVKENIHADEHGAPIYLSTWDADGVRVPLIDTEADIGKYVEGIFHAGRAADGVHVRAVSEWLTPREIAAQMVLSHTETGQQLSAGYMQITPVVFRSFIPREVADQVMSIIQLTADYGFYGPASEAKQPQSDAYLGGVIKSSWKEYVRRTGPWLWPDITSSRECQFPTTAETA